MRIPETCVLETQRLVLDHLTLDDADFMVELLNEPAFLRFVGDRGVRTAEDAREYLRENPIRSYEQHGFGVLRVRLQGDPTREALGICGLVRRDFLDDPDVGFAFLARHRKRGYATESARGVLEWARAGLGLRRVLALVDPQNEGSIELIEELGMTFERMIQVSEDEPEIRLYALDLDARV